ncbi:hypothetical protein POPTR_002G178100v4 [Populus trichocarpa]|uniref:Uncharacterized protein n=1 Tax=Populus trichocarpa TaxID=3694 RepID=A0ACC0TEQ1_POPTR|nr:uncharacterized protein LOC7478796 [Populus trichocarpa]KAI9400001.1 hypothetical protein POPTR_002G178100v4 [Populus trichocarpa]
MWWATSPVQPRPFFPLLPGPAKSVKTLTFSAKAQPSSHQPSPTSKHQQQQGEGRRAKQFSGFDVLWAMQRATAEKNKVSGGGGGKKNNKTRKGFVSGGIQREENSVEYSNVKPLCIKNDWDVRLDELEKRLQELSDTN